MVEESASTAAKIPRRRSLAWPPFEDQLTAVLGALEEDQFLVITVKRTNRFVQFAAQGSFGMRAEATGNRYLARSERLDPGQIAELVATGWQNPTGSPEESTPEDDPDGSPNFFLEFPAPVCCPEAAGLAVDTLARILRVPHPGFLEYEAFDTDGNAILLPSLGLKRAIRPLRPRNRPHCPTNSSLPSGRPWARRISSWIVTATSGFVTGAALSSQV